MAGEIQANATCRFIRRAGRDDKTIVMIQVRKFLLWWKDWFPIENAVRALEHEALELYERLREIQDEHKVATKWVEETRKRALNDCQKNGKGPSFPYHVGPQESEMPDFSEEFKRVMKTIEGKAKNRSTTGYNLPQHAGLIDKKVVAETDHHMMFREPQQNNSRNRGKNNQNHNKSQGGGGDNSNRN